MKGDKFTVGVTHWRNPDRWDHYWSTDLLPNALVAFHHACQSSFYSEIGLFVGRATDTSEDCPAPDSDRLWWNRALRYYQNNRDRSGWSIYCPAASSWVNSLPAAYFGGRQ